MRQRWLMSAAAGRWHRFPPASPPTKILGPCSVSFISEWVRLWVCASASTPNLAPGTLAYWLSKLCAPQVGSHMVPWHGHESPLWTAGWEPQCLKCEVILSAAHCSYKGPLYFQSRLRKTLMQHINVYTVNTCKDTPDVPDVGEINSKDSYALCDFRPYWGAMITIMRDTWRNLATKNSLQLK